MKMLTRLGKIICSMLYVLGFLIVLLSACNNDFLNDEGLPDIYETEDTLYITSYASPFNMSLPLYLSDGASWRMVQYPLWLDIEPKEGKNVNGENIDFSFTVHKDLFNYGLGAYEIPLVFESVGRGLESKTIVYYNMSNPNIEVTPNNLRLVDEQVGTITIDNSGFGLLYWEVISQPEWLELSDSSGTIDPYQSGELNYSVSTELMEQGEHKGEVVMVNSAGRDLHIPVNWTVNNVARQGVFFEDELVGTLFLKEESTFVALTKNQNRLLYFNEQNSKLVYKDLDREPTCMTNLDNGKIAIGFSNAEVSILDVMTGEVEVTYSVQYIPKTIVFAGQNYLYYAAEVGASDYLYCYHISTDEVIVSNRVINGVGILKPIYSRDIMMFIKPGHSPDGLYFYNTSEGDVNQFNKYHMDTGGFWLSEDGNRFYTQNRKVFQVPDENELSFDSSYLSGTPPQIGQFGVGDNQFTASVGEDLESGFFYVASNVYSTAKGEIRIYNRDNFVLQKSIPFEVPRPYNFSVYNTWSVRTAGIYPDATGSKVWLLHRYPGSYSYESGMWSVVLMDLE